MIYSGGPPTRCCFVNDATEMQRFPLLEAPGSGFEVHVWIDRH